MARGRADIANTALRIFLQEIGIAYDLERGLEPWKVNKHFPEVKKFFGNRCCYCDAPFDEGTKANQDHLIPINKTDLGLHAWGNIVPACAGCNNARQRTDWRAFIIQRAGEHASERHSAVGDFLAQYKYEPIFELRAISDELYDEMGSIAMTLIEAKIKRIRARM